MSRVTRYWRHRLQGERPWDLEMIGLAVAALGWQVDPAPQRQLQSLFLPQEMSSASRYSGPYLYADQEADGFCAPIFSAVFKEVGAAAPSCPRGGTRPARRRSPSADSSRRGCFW